MDGKRLFEEITYPDSHEKGDDSFITVTPGIRFEDGNVGEQVRVMTPAQAKREGADYIVVGRPITQADNPLEAYHRCKKEFCA